MLSNIGLPIDIGHLTGPLLGITFRTLLPKAVNWLGSLIAAMRLSRVIRPRAGADRRVADRRVQPVHFRLADGLWRAYHEATGHGMTRAIKLNGGEQSLLFRSLIDEVRRYELRSRIGGQPVPAEEVLYAAIKTAATERETQRTPALDAVRAIATYIHSNFDVTAKGRRASSERRGAIHDAA